MVLGITGITGSGKHLAADFFKQRGWIVLDVDKIAHYFYRPYTSVWKAVVDHFGEGILTRSDTIDRQKLGAIVFDHKDPEMAEKELKALGEIVHPSIRLHLKNEVHRYFRRKSNIVIVAALWNEVGLFDVADKVLLLRTHSDVGKERVMKRDSIPESMYLMRAKNQSEPPHPDFLVENNGTAKDLYQELAKLGV